MSERGRKWGEGRRILKWGVYMRGTMGLPRFYDERKNGEEEEGSSGQFPWTMARLSLGNEGQWGLGKLGKPSDGAMFCSKNTASWTQLGKPIIEAQKVKNRYMLSSQTLPQWLGQV